MRADPHHLTARFRRDDRGATAVEFAMVAMPFFMLLFAILEIALIFMVSTTMESAMGEAGRTIRTGEMQTGNAARTPPRSNSQLAGDFKQEICANLGWLTGSCQRNLYVDVRTFAQFNDVNAVEPINGPANNRTLNTGAMTFTPGGPGEIVLVRAFFRWSIITPLMNPGLVELGDGSRLITATAIFRNEPYQS